MYNIDKNRLREIIDKRLMNVPFEIKKLFPPTLSRPTVYWFTIPTEKDFILSFGGGLEKERIEKLLKKNLYPYPGLIASDINGPIAYTIEKSKNNFFEDCIIKDMYGFFLGKDTTLILCQFKHSIYTKELGEYDYRIDLAYVLSFGDEITHDNFYDYLDNLIAYSVAQWRGQNA